MILEDLPEVYFGDPNVETDVDFTQIVDEDPDDEELEKTPDDLIAILGFDPKDLNKSDE